MVQPLLSPTAPTAGRGWLLLLRVLLLSLLATWAAGCASLPSNVVRPVSRALNSPDETPLGRLTQQRRTQAGARSDSGFRLLDSVDIAFTSRVALIEGAQRTLDLQYYAIHADSSTELLLQRLRSAAARGVRVRILLDDFNSVGADAQVLRLAFLKNIELRLFNPLPGSRASLLGRIFTSLHEVDQIQKRMHNKLFIADNAWGITGGRNLCNAYFGRGMALGRMGLVDEGIADLSVFIRRHPESSVAYTKRGVRNIWRNNLVEAERDLARAVQLDPSNAEAHDDLGVVHAKNNRIHQAAQHFSTAIRLDPSYQKAYHNLAICYHMTGQNPKALEIVDAGLLLDPDSRETLMLKSTILQTLGKTEEAKKIEERAEFLPEGNWTERSEVGTASTQGDSK